MREDSTIYFCRVKLADKIFEIESLNKLVLCYYREYLIANEPTDYVIKTTPEEIKDEFCSKHKDAYQPNDDKKIATEYIDAEFLLHLRKIADYLTKQGILLLHGVSIEIDNKGYVFIAPSGTGKTTHVLNWISCFPDTIIINGDKPFLNVERRVLYGSPWSGKEGLNTNTSAPLAGIIALERAKDNVIVPITFREMLPDIIQQTYIPSSDVIHTYKCIGMLKNVPFYRLRCNIERDSAFIAYDGIKKYEQLQR